MQLKYENIYIINEQEKKTNDLNQESRTKITEELKLRIMQSFGYRPKNTNPTKNKISSSQKS